MVNLFKALIFIWAVFALSCATQVAILPTTSDGGFVYSGHDFRKYSEQDFLITTTKPVGNYVSKGIIQVSLYPEVSRHYSITSRNIALTNDGIFEYEDKLFELFSISSEKGKKLYYRVEITSTEAAIDEIVNTATEWGADAIYEFRVENETIIDNGLVKGMENIWFCS